MTASSIGKILTLFVSVNESSTRIEKQIITLDVNGITQDKYYNTNKVRSVLITSYDSYVLAGKHNIKMPLGSLGENLLIDYNPYHLTTGTKLYVGDTILEISQNCTMCDHLSKIDKELPKLLKHDRGIFAKVIRGGVIKKGDEIYLSN